MTNLIIVDASGSMEGRKVEVRGGINQLLTEIKEDKRKKQRSIVVDFSSSNDIRVIVDNTDKKTIDTTIGDKYSTRGMTALYDAVAKAISLVPIEEKKVFVSIITDGGENDSKEYDGVALKALVEARKKNGWAFVFMGTDESCLANARAMGISAGNTMSYDANGGYSGFSGMMGYSGASGYSGYSGTASYARTAYMSASVGVAADNLLEEAEKLRNKQDKKLGLLK